jgi:cyclophilin family peptidyl-prolyl cis-trans isomerase
MSIRQESACVLWNIERRCGTRIGTARYDLFCSGTEHTRDEFGNIEDELIKGLSNVEGTLSMANSGDPDTGGSQFFINLKDNTRLDWFCGDSESFHPVFGKVIEGYEKVIKKMEKVEISAEQPVNPIKMLSVRIEET